MNTREATMSQGRLRTRAQNNHHVVDRGSKGLVGVNPTVNQGISTTSKNFTTPKRQEPVSKVSKTSKKAKDSPSGKNSLGRGILRDKRPKDIR